MHKLKLISFELCPFVQRSVITLNYKNIHHEVLYIDLKNKPDWFLKISPTGKVPLLKENDEVLFESAVINEYLDEITGGNLLPSPPLEKAQSRAFIEFTSSVIMLMYQTMMSPSKEDFDLNLNTLKEKLQFLEDKCEGKETILSSGFSLLDTATIPLLQRLKFMDENYSTDILERFPKLNTITEFQLKQEYVIKSVPDSFNTKMLQYIQDTNTYLSSK